MIHVTLPRIGGPCKLCGRPDIEHGNGSCPRAEAPAPRPEPERMTAPPALYAVMYPELVRIARAHGYALAIHGSMTRDFDLIAVPWTDQAGEPFPMVEEMKYAVRGVYLHHEVDHIVKDGKAEDKPHGRRAWSIHLTEKGCDGPYIDLSVMPRAA